MSQENDFFDYAPVTRSKRSKLVTLDGEPEEVVPPSRGQSEHPSKPPWAGNPAAKNAQVASIDSERNAAHVFADKHGILKRGHAVSFAGLFLFTLLVFVRPYELSPWLTWLSRAALITALLTLVVFIPTQLGLENRITVRTREVNLVLLLLLLALVSVPFALDSVQAWNAFVEYSKVVVMFVVMVNVVRTEVRLKALLLLVLAVSVALSLGAIIDYRAGNLALGGKRIAGIIGGLFENPNDLALHLVTFFPIVVALALAARTSLAKFFYLVVSITLVAGTIVTFSRAGFVGLIAVFGTLAYRLLSKNRTLVGIATVLFVILFMALAPGAYRQRVTTSDESSQARTGELKRSIFLTVRHPFVGVGMDNFVLFSNTEHATHNSYTQVSSELGIPAGVVYVLFLIAALKRTQKMPTPKEVDKKRRRLAYLGIGLQASMIGYMVVSFFASVAYLWYVYYLVGYVICLSRLNEQVLARTRQ